MNSKGILQTSLARTKIPLALTSNACQESEKLVDTTRSVHNVYVFNRSSLMDPCSLLLPNRNQCLQLGIPQESRKNLGLACYDGVPESGSAARIRNRNRAQLFATD